MKIRLGFVSNSSSSSFCIYGVCLDQYQLDEYLGINTFDCDCENKCTCGYVEDIYEEFEKEKYRDTKVRLEVQCSDNGDFYIGAPLAHCPDDMTMGWYKQTTKEIFQKILKKKLPKDLNLDIIEEVISC